MIVKKAPRWAWHLLLGLCMLLMQQGALRHSLSHDPQDEASPAHQVCLSCLAFHAGDQVVHSPPPALVLLGALHAPPSSAVYRDAAPLPVVRYHARAPPLLG